MVTDQAIVVGGTSLPAPQGNSDASWFVWEPWIASLTFGSAIGFQELVGHASGFVIDSKAMRKVGNNEDMAIRVSNVDAADGALVQLVGRMLVKLH